MYGHVSALLGDKGRQVYTVAPTATVREAVRAMNEKGVGALLVIEEGCPVGIFTERDVLRRVVDEGRNPQSTRVAEVMTQDVLVVEPTTPVEKVMATMTERRIRHLPVVEDGKLVGLVSIGDVTRWVSVNQEAHIQQMTDYITGRSPA
jgi:CBS domain-containing protein